MLVDTVGRLKDWLLNNMACVTGYNGCVLHKSGVSASSILCRLT